MTECLPNLPRFIIEREDGSWQGADHPDGPWRSIPAPQQALPWPTDGPAVPEGREPASVATQPSNRELLELMPETMRDEFAYAAKICSEATGGQVKPRIFRVCLNTAALEYARAVLARWGRPTPAPAGEHQVAPVPVPVSERLPGPGDCAPWPDDPDTQPWCWLGNVIDGGWEWHQQSPGILTFIRDSYTHWLPATDLPLPAAEAQP